MSMHYQRLHHAAALTLLLAISGCSGSGTVIEGGFPQEVAVTVAPTSASVPVVGQQAFASLVTGTADTSVTWQVGPGCGTISTGGLYTAPAVARVCQVVATSVADATKSATAVVTVRDGTPPPVNGDTVWEALKIGAGGFLSGMDIDQSGTTYVARADTYGAFVGDGVGPWTQVVTSRSMPAATVAGFLANDTPWLSAGVYEIRVAPTVADRLYMIYVGAVWRSDDRGATWVPATTGYVAGAINPNDSFRTRGQKMAVDPANPDVVYAGARGGLYVTTNGGASWSLVPGIPAPTSAASMTGIVFDPSSGTTGGRTNTIYAVSNGNGVYRSTNAGASWSALGGGPAECMFAAVSQAGVYFAVHATANTLHRYAGAWTTPSPGDWAMAVAADPFNPARVVAMRGSGHLSVSSDAGVTWSGWRWSTTTAATDIPWLATANGMVQKAPAAALFDPVVQDRLWMSEGIGVWFTNPTTTTTAWHSYSAGIEQLVGRDVLVPPGGAYVFTAGMDRAVFRTARDNRSYPTGDITMGSGATLIGAWALDYSKLNPRHIVAIVNGQSGGDLSGYSLDDGATWTRFPVQPATGTSGDILALGIDNIIAVVGGDGRAFRSTNRGASWTQLPGVPTGLHAGYAIRKHILAADGGYDGVNNRTVYLYAYGSGVWRSTDDGATWSRPGTFTVAGDYWQTKLRSVPGQPGHLFLTAGQQGGTGQANPHNATALYRSTNGGATWTAVAGTGEPYDVAVGAAAPGHAYPAIYFAGWYNGVWGIWRSIDDAATWTQTGQFPNGSLDHINVLTASQDTFGEIYVAFDGSGWAVGRVQ